MNKIIFYLVVLLLIVIAYIIVRWVYMSNVAAQNRTVVFAGTKSAREVNSVSLNPGANENHVALERSLNQPKGIEFSYTMWLKIHGNTWSDTRTAKHIMHKGNSSAYPNQGPGIWIKKDTNVIRVIMNSHVSVDKNFVDIANIPVNKWFHLAVIITTTHIDVHVNGILVQHKRMDGIPRQNFSGNLHVTENGGFDGKIADMYYYNKAIPNHVIKYLTRRRPSDKIDGENVENALYPPFLSTYWWQSSAYDDEVMHNQNRYYVPSGQYT